MDNSGQIRCVLLYNTKCIFRRITTVNIYRKSDLSRQIKLSDEPLLLNLSRLHIPVVIKTNLTDSNHFRIVTHFLQTRQRINELLSALDEADRKLLPLRYGLEGGKPLDPETAGRKLGLTPEEAVAREAAALSLLRQR